MNSEQECRRSIEVESRHLTGRE